MNTLIYFYLIICCVIQPMLALKPSNRLFFIDMNPARLKFGAAAIDVCNSIAVCNSTANMRHF